MADETAGLSPSQHHTLFDILTHRETYAEIEAFKQPDAIQHYGPPFQDDSKSQSISPILQTLLSEFALPLPGLRDVKPEFWKTHVIALIQGLARAELSESYDKGVLGVRKTLATAVSALIEYPARGVTEGIQQEEDWSSIKQRQYDLGNPEDVLRSWPDTLQGLVYGELVDELFQKAAETDDLSKHGSLVQAMHEFVVVK